MPPLTPRASSDFIRALFGYDFKLAFAATDTADGAAFYAEERIHFVRGVFVSAVRVMNENVIDRLYLSRSRAAERSDGRSERKHPYGRADRNFVVSRKVDIYRLDRHIPPVHAEPTAPPETERSIRFLGGFYFVNSRAAPYLDFDFIFSALRCCCRFFCYIIRLYFAFVKSDEPSRANRRCLYLQ